MISPHNSFNELAHTVTPSFFAINDFRRYFTVIKPAMVIELDIWRKWSFEIPVDSQKGTVKISSFANSEYMYS